MVITLSLLPQKAAGQLNTLVNFESALPTLGGQFSVGVNTHLSQSITNSTSSQTKKGLQHQHVQPFSLS